MLLDATYMHACMIDSLHRYMLKMSFVRMAINGDLIERVGCFLGYKIEKKTHIYIYN